MNEFTVNILNAFVDGGRGGNPAGVVLNADKLTAEQKLSIAAKVGLSETAFVSASATADFKLDFFTPTRQIAHCGHATIATFSYLAQQGMIAGSHSSKETIEGRREIYIRDGLAFMEQLGPKYTPLGETAVSLGEVLASLHIKADDLLSGFEPIVANTGVNGLIVPLVNEAAVAGIEPDFSAVAEVSETLDLVEYYVFSRETKVAGRDAGARMFAPRYGIPEESATGMAAGPLGCYLYDYLGVKKDKLVIEQGHLMKPPSPSELLVELNLEDDQIKDLLVGGQGMLSETIIVHL
jgi:PhzF family phenazine biosynthesis protein